LKPDPQALQRPEQSVASRSQESTGGIFLPPHERHRMATETKIRIRRNPYSGYEVWIYGNGELTRRSFDNSIDLSWKLAADCFSDETIEAACDMLDRLEWEEPEFPLGVNYIGGYVTSNSPVYAPLSQETSEKQGFSSDVEQSRFWDWLAATIRLGAITAPWVAIVILVRWAGGW